MIDDIGHLGQRLHVIDGSGFTEETVGCREGRLDAREATFAFDGFKQRRLLATDISAGAAADFDIYTVPRAENVLAQVSSRMQFLERRIDTFDRKRIFAADVDIDAACADRIGADDRTFENSAGIAL